jgi:hypothetical protein
MIGFDGEGGIAASAAIVFMESGQKSLNELRSSMLASDGQVFVRLVVDAGLRTVWYVDVVVGAPADPPGWQSQIWRY